MLEHYAASTSAVERARKRQVRVVDRLVDVGDQIIEVEAIGRLSQDHRLQQIAEAHLLGLAEPRRGDAEACVDGLLQQLVRRLVGRQAQQDRDARCGDDVVGGELTYHWFSPVGGVWLGP